MRSCEICPLFVLAVSELCVIGNLVSRAPPYFTALVRYGKRIAMKRVIHSEDLRLVRNMCQLWINRDGYVDTLGHSQNYVRRHLGTFANMRVPW